LDGSPNGMENTMGQIMGMLQMKNNKKPE
jgi:hypothetical protein